MILFMRHGETEANSNQDPSHEAVRSDTDQLTDEGRQQVADTAERLARLDPPLNSIVACDTPRAKESASIVGKRLGLDPIFTPFLRTWAMGQLQGQPMSKAADIIKYHVQHPNEPIPGGTSYNQFLATYLPFISPLFHDQNARALLLQHGQNNRAADAWISAGAKGLDLDSKVAADHVGVQHGGLAVAQPPGTFRIIDPKVSYTGLS